jgi:hypothetical protein
MWKPFRSKTIWILAAALVLAGVGVCLMVIDQRGSPQPPMGHFRDVALASGITFKMNFLSNEQGEKFKVNLYDHGTGVAVGDYDGDGHDDIYFVNQLGQNGLFRNKGDGTFEEVTEAAGVGLGDRICVGATWADYDNDGHQDLFVTSTRGGNVLFRNLGNGTFKDVTKEAGLVHVGHSQTAVFFDYDNDGYLDLFLTNSAEWTTNQLDEIDKYYPGKSDLVGLGRSKKEFNILYHNNGDGTFTDVTEKAGLKGQGWGGDVVIFDYNEDGFPDLLVTNMFGASQLYRNNGDGTFTDATKETLGRTSWGAIGGKAFDFDNDGKLDLLIMDMHSDMWMPSSRGVYAVPREIEEMIKQNDKRKYPYVSGPAYEFDPGFQAKEKQLADLFRIRYDDVIFGNTLFKNLGNGKFEEVSDNAGMETLWPWGIATGDFDNDGFEDVFIPSGMGYPFFYWPNALMMNNGDQTFTDRAADEGIEPPVGGIYLETRIGTRKAPRSSRCAATADFDGDGRLDIITNNFNDRPYYFRNHFPSKNYVAFRLRGTRSNRDAIGALVYLYNGKEKQVRQVNPAGGYLSQSSKTVHFGLGDRTEIESVEIRWPSGIHQTLNKPAINTLHEVTEPVDGKPRPAVPVDRVGPVRVSRL